MKSQFSVLNSFQDIRFPNLKLNFFLYFTFYSFQDNSVHTDRSTRIVIFIKNIYFLWGLPVTNFPTNLEYPFNLRGRGINIENDSWARP